MILQSVLGIHGPYKSLASSNNGTHHPHCPKLKGDCIYYSGFEGKVNQILSTPRLERFSVKSLQLHRLGDFPRARVVPDMPLWARHFRPACVARRVTTVIPRGLKSLILLSVGHRVK